MHAALPYHVICTQQCIILAWQQINHSHMHAIDGYGTISHDTEETFSCANLFMLTMRVKHQLHKFAPHKFIMLEHVTSILLPFK